MPTEFRFDRRLNRLTWEAKDEPVNLEEAKIISAQQLAFAAEQIANSIRDFTSLYAKK